MIVLRLAWRNVWRNVRRTGLTIAATVFAVFLVVVFIAMGDGIHSKMVEDSVRIQSGHVQLAGAGYLENRTLEYGMRWTPELEAAVSKVEAVEAWAPRVTSAALLSVDDASHGVLLIGLDPAREVGLSTLAERVTEGTFLPDDVPNGIVLGEQLAKNLAAEIGDEVLVFSMAYTLQNAYELFTLTGTMKLPDPALERSFAVVELASLQTFLEFGDRVTEVALLAESAADVPDIEASLATLDLAAAGLEVNAWDDVMPDLAQFIVIDDAGMYVLLIILIVIVGFGILNTILMSVMERQRELGAMLALGLRPLRIFQMIYAESLFMAAIGLVIGLALALPTVWILGLNPIPIPGGEEMAAAAALVGMEPVIVFELRDSTLPGAALTIAIVAALAALYPAIKASRARPVDALRSL